MSLLSRISRIGTYDILVKCENCGFNSTVKVSKGIPVADFIKTGKCKCDNCGVIFFPKEYTTVDFEAEKKSKELFK